MSTDNSPTSVATSAPTSGTAPDIDLDAFRSALSAMPQFTFIGTCMKISYRTGIEFHGYLANVLPDLLIVHHCTLTSDPAIHDTPARSTATTTMPSSSPARAATTASSAPPTASPVRAASPAPGARATTPADRSAASVAPVPSRSPARALQSVGVANATVLRKYVTRVDPLDGSAVLPRRWSAAGEKLDAEMFVRRLIVQRALGAIREEVSDAEWLAEQCGAQLIEVPTRSCRDESPLATHPDNTPDNESAFPSACPSAAPSAIDASSPWSARASAPSKTVTRGDVDALRSELFTNVVAAQRMERFRPALAAGANGGAAVNQLFGVANEGEVRALLREERLTAFTFCTIAAYLLTLFASAGAAYAGYLFVVLGAYNQIFDSIISGLRITAMAYSGVCLIFSLVLGFERTNLVELQINTAQYWTRVVFAVILAPASIFAIIVCASLSGFDWDIIARESLNDAYLDAGVNGQLCCYFKDNSCSGFSQPCSAHGSVCPTDCPTAIIFKTPCEPLLHSTLQGFVRPMLVIVVLIVVSAIASLVLQWRLQWMVRDVIAILQPAPPPPPPTAAAAAPPPTAAAAAPVAAVSGVQDRHSAPTAVGQAQREPQATQPAAQAQ